MIKKLLFVAYAGLLAVWGAGAAPPTPTRVACIGNSITFGAGLSDRERECYPAQLGGMLGPGYEVRNFGQNSRTALIEGDYPYIEDEALARALAFGPRIVVIALGTNDSKPHNWQHGEAFGKDLARLVETFREAADSTQTTPPALYLCRPPKAYGNRYGIRDSVIVNEIIPEIDRVAAACGAGVIDLHAATDGIPQHFPDQIHPDAQGAAAIARAVCRAITAPRSDQRPGLPGFKSAWNGYHRYDFRFNGREAIVVAPDRPAPGNPWIWRPAFFGAFASVDTALLARGFHVAYYDLTHLYGTPEALALGSLFFEAMSGSYGLAPRVTLEGFSRGGLFALNWAAANPDRVACLYLDAPVCDVFSWPGRKNAALWSDLLTRWELTDEQMNRFGGNPIDNLAPIAQAHIPVIAVCGDSDRVVPFSENMAVVRDRLASMGCPAEVILKPGCDHHPHSLENPAPVVEFILRHGGNGPSH